MTIGNWRTVNIKGNMSCHEAFAMSSLLSNKFNKPSDDPSFCLHFEDSRYSGRGLGRWVSERGAIDGRGNLYERGFNNDDIEAALTYLAAKFPSLSLTLHSGDDFEDLKCTATFHVSGGVCKRCEPEVEYIKPKYEYEDVVA